ncbi:MAG: hypothetical protein INF18_15100 [Methylobacterium sp.]|nr:hypothetical protein [Methylobacterium sp.]
MKAGKLGSRCHCVEVDLSGNCALVAAALLSTLTVPAALLLPLVLPGLAGEANGSDVQPAALVFREPQHLPERPRTPSPERCRGLPDDGLAITVPKVPRERCKVLPRRVDRIGRHWLREFEQGMMQNSNPVPGWRGLEAAMAEELLDLHKADRAEGTRSGPALPRRTALGPVRIANFNRVIVAFRARHAAPRSSGPESRGGRSHESRAATIDFTWSTASSASARAIASGKPARVRSEKMMRQTLT